MNKWDEIKNYINNNEIIERKNLDTNGATIDRYLGIFRNCEFIKRIDNGKYKRLCLIPHFINSKTLKDVEYDKEKRIKLIRKLKLEEIKTKNCQ